VSALIQKSKKTPKDAPNQANIAGSSRAHVAENKSDNILKTQLVQQDFSSAERHKTVHGIMPFMPRAA
jgi:hypothetical protein